MPQQLGVEIGVAHTTQRHALGAIHVVPASGTTPAAHYMYLQADGAVTKDLLYNYDMATGQIEDQADATNFPQDAENAVLCVSPVTLADNEFAWVFIGPGGITLTTDSNGATAEAILYVSATAGTVSSTATAALLKTAHCQTTITGGATGTVYFAGRIWSEDLP